MEMAVTLDQLLKSRDLRYATEKQLLKDNPDKTLVVLTVVSPGAEKVTEESIIAFDAAMAAISYEFVEDICDVSVNKLETGYEAYYILSIPQRLAKKRCVMIEENHPLGRLFDIDVIGEGCVPMSRTEVDANPRKCLVCGKNARLCMRERIHSLDEILSEVKRLTDEWVSRH